MQPSWLQRSALFIVVAILSAPALGQVLFEDDFETGDFASGPSPTFAWRASPTRANIETSMFRGENDIYSVTTERVFSGDYALKLDFTGRNSWCKTCGAAQAVLNATTASTGCFSANASGPFADELFNKSNGFSSWSVESVNGQQVCIDTNRAAGDPVINESAGLRAGDEMRIPYVCGVNGQVTNDASRRSDCNRAINYLLNVGTSDLDYGETIARRFYLYIPSTATLPNITFKLGYSRWRREGESSRNATLKLSVQRDLRVTLTAPNSESINVDAFATRDEWIYFEETFTRESGPGARDASYRLYMGSADESLSRLTSPILVRSGFELGALIDMSTHGNWQHTNDIFGAVYYDEIVIAKGFVGPADYNPARPPAARVNDLR